MGSFTLGEPVYISTVKSYIFGTHLLIIEEAECLNKTFPPPQLIVSYWLQPFFFCATCNIHYFHSNSLL